MEDIQTIVTQETIQNQIFTNRGKQVMLDRDLAILFGVETKVLNQAVKRNLDRFPDNFRFQLTEHEQIELVTFCDRFKMLKHSTSLMYAFSEVGVVMLSSVLRSQVAISVSITTTYSFDCKDGKVFKAENLNMNKKDRMFNQLGEQKHLIWMRSLLKTSYRHS